MLPFSHPQQLPPAVGAVHNDGNGPRPLNNDRRPRADRLDNDRRRVADNDDLGAAYILLVDVTGVIVGPTSIAGVVATVYAVSGVITAVATISAVVATIPALGDGDSKGRKGENDEAMHYD